ncbi:Alpha/beta hydrolase fold-1 [Fusarium austroafricanum]|uniref:Alpha/beta hydrolase fold-1 n=1 Tax=Fusarium austroafricanum TaxID=2364996 RepID=A0A8H4P1J9_9HYPO|nr:Alpha/beta hydrolase fold-1 [Fusarium austroafricanum]
MNNPWELDHYREELVSVDIGASQPQQLFLSVRGPPRTSPEQPVAIIECGAAATTRWWTIVQRLLCPTLRVYCYDRAGLGRSGPAVVFPRTASSMAFEMEKLFETVGVKPRFILIAHSYGAIIAREFLARLPNPTQSVVGMVFVESNQEKTHQELMVSSHISTSLGGLNSLVATGLHEDHQYSEAEVEAILKYESGTTTNISDKPSAAISELESMESSERALADREQLQKHILSPNPITVMRGDITRDLRRLFKTSGAAAAGNSTTIP